jgi:hypothetical protein
MSTEAAGAAPRDGFDAYRDDRPNAFVWLQGWYASHCDGDWEHQYGVHIDTLDNPGWTIRIDLVGTELAGRAFERQELHRSEDDWVVAWLADGVWEAACRPLNLGEALHCFREWAT